MTITLYDMHDSPHARISRLLAAELGLPLETIARDPRKGETRSTDNLAKNPNGRVPVLAEDGFELWESLAILRYLAAMRPVRALGGGEDKVTPESYRVNSQWLFWSAGGPEAAIDARFGSASSQRRISALARPGNDPDDLARAGGHEIPLLPPVLFVMGENDHLAPAAISRRR